MNARTKEAIKHLVSTSRDAIACAVDENGYPTAKTLFVRKCEGLHTFWFSTNTSAIRTAQWQADPKACIYFVDHVGFHGLMLTGTMQVCLDDESKRAIWQPGDEMYYPKGVSDPDYAVLRFTAERGNYYHGLEKALFAIDEIAES